MIVDFAVVYNPDSSVFVTDWLLTSLQVDNAQAAHRQTYVSRDVKACVIRTPVQDLLVHGFEDRTLYFALAIKVEDATDPAHD
jgi:hypothetical protein